MTIGIVELPFDKLPEPKPTANPAIIALIEATILRLFIFFKWYSASSFPLERRLISLHLTGLSFLKNFRLFIPVRFR